MLKRIVIVMLKSVFEKKGKLALTTYKALYGWDPQVLRDV